MAGRQRSRTPPGLRSPTIGPMPVVVTGAAGLIGRRTVAALSGVSPEVRAYIRRREPASALRELGAKVAVGPLDDPDTLRTVMRGAHTVCHLAGGLEAEDEAAAAEGILGPVEAALGAATAAGVARFLYVSCAGASARAGDVCLRFQGLAEEAVARSGLEHAIVRSTLVLGPGSRWLEALRTMAAGFPAWVVGPGTQVLAPVFVEDLAAVLAAADDRRGEIGGTWGLEGPDRVSADELADLLAGRRRRRLHRSPAAARRAGRQGARGLSRSLLEILAGGSTADAPDAAAEFGVARTPLRAALERSLGWPPGLEG